MAEKTRNRQARLQLAMAAISFAVAFVASTFREDLYRFFYVEPQILILMIGALVAQGIAFLLLLYLRGDIAVSFLDRLLVKQPENIASDFSSVIHDNDTELAKFRAEIASIQARLASFGDGSTASSSVDYDRLVESLRSYVTENLAGVLATKFEKESRNAVHLNLVRNTFQETAARLLIEIGSLTRRGNLNLVIGVVTTGFAVGLLVYMVLDASSSFETWTALLSHYIPRITTVAFIEVFAFFFLRLYRNSLAEIKYYQNELTTLASQHIAFEAAYGLDEEKAKLAVITQLVKTSRNHDPAVALEEKPTTGGNLKELSEILERVTKLVVSSAKREKAE